MVIHTITRWVGRYKPVNNHLLTAQRLAGKDDQRSISRLCENDGRRITEYADQKKSLKVKVKILNHP